MREEYLDWSQCKYFLLFYAHYLFLEPLKVDYSNFTRSLWLRSATKLIISADRKDRAFKFYAELWTEEHNKIYTHRCPLNVHGQAWSRDKNFNFTPLLIDNSNFTQCLGGRKSNFCHVSWTRGASRTFFSTRISFLRLGSSRESVRRRDARNTENSTLAVNLVELWEVCA